MRKIQGNDGKVRVTYPWLDGSAASGKPQMVSEWSRVAQFFAGPDHGAFFMPLKGSEVLLAFIHGDMRRPVIIGGLSNGIDHRRARAPISTRTSATCASSRPPGTASACSIRNEQHCGAVIIETSNGSFISMSTTGTVRIKAKGALEIEGASIRINGRIVAPSMNSI